MMAGSQELLAIFLGVICNIGIKKSKKIKTNFFIRVD